MRHYSDTAMAQFSRNLRLRGLGLRMDKRGVSVVKTYGLGIHRVVKRFTTLHQAYLWSKRHG